MRPAHKIVRYAGPLGVLYLFLFWGLIAPRSLFAFLLDFGTTPAGVIARAFVGCIAVGLAFIAIAGERLE